MSGYKSHSTPIDKLLLDKRMDEIEKETPEEIDVTQFKPITSKEMIEILGLTIKKDDENKLITFLAMLSAYTDSAQLNISFNAPSSSGKSYIPTEIATLFPKEDVKEVGYCSPTAFFHDKAEKYNKETNELIVNLSHKIIIFLDQPHTLLLQHLRPILSHDKTEVTLKITDKSQKAGLRTKNVVLKGFPSVIFCTAGLRIDEQESTRFLLLSPEVNQEKIREAIKEKISRTINNVFYNQQLEENINRQLLKKRIMAIKQANIKDIQINNRGMIENLFNERVKMFKPRHQRDIGRIISLIKIFTLINLWFREKVKDSIIATDQDIQEAFNLWDTISEAQELNLPPFVYNLYKEVIIAGYEEKNKMMVAGPKGLTRQDILTKHFEVYGRHLPDYQLRKEIITMLETAGLIFQEADKEDRRIILIYPTTLSTISSASNNSGVDGGVTEDEIDKQLGITD